MSHQLQYCYPVLEFFLCLLSCVQSLQKHLLFPFQLRFVGRNKPPKRKLEEESGYNPTNDWPNNDRP